MIHQIPKQYALLLLHSSFQQQLRHLLRQLQLEGLADLWKEADQLLELAVS